MRPLTSVEGGGLWTQLEDEESLKKGEEVAVEEVKPGCELKGRVVKAVKGKAFSFDPRRWHEVQPHEGERVTVIAYTPRLSNLDPGDAAHLKNLGFRPFGEKETICEVTYKDALLEPDAQINDDEEAGCASSLLVLNETHYQLLEDLQERSRSLRLLMEEAEDLRQAGKLVEEESEKVQQSIEGMLKQASSRLSRQERAMLKVCLRAASEATDPDYEQLLESLEGDLQVVHKSG